MTCQHRWPNGRQCCHIERAGSAFCQGHDPACHEERRKLGRRSRRKGSTFEREVARDLRPIFGEGVKRGLAQKRAGIGEAPDVDGCPPLWIETKCGDQPSLRAALRQAEEGMAIARRPQDRWPVAVCKDDQALPGAGAETWVVMRWGVFKELLREWYDERKTHPNQPSSGASPINPKH